MEKKHDLMFCPECGVKLEGDEFVCSICGFKLVASTQNPNPEPILVAPVTPVEPQNIQNQQKKHDLAFCPGCGAKLDGDEVICSICGTRLVENTAPVTSTPIPQPQNIVNTPVVPPIIVSESITETPPAVKKHDLLFCPECGAKLDGDETICSICGYKLVAVSETIKVETPIISEPVQTPEPPVIEITPPPVMAEPIQEIPVTEPLAVEKKHDLLFCPECGAKLDGDETICSICGYKLVAVLEPIKVEKPIVSEPIQIPEPPIVTEPPVIVEPPVVSEPDQTPEPPVIDETPVVPEPPVIVETPVTPEPPVIVEPIVIESTPPPVFVPEPKQEAPIPEPAPIVKKHDLLFCPECGQKLMGDEVVCPKCGYKLLAEPVIVVPPVVKPIEPAVNNYYTPPVNPPTSFAPPKKKKKTGLIIFLILLIVILIGGGTVGFLQYNGNINIAFLESIIPSKNSQSNPGSPLVTDHTRYYVCHSFAAVGTKMTVIISSTIVSKKPYNNKDGAIVQFKKAISKKFPKDYSNFTTVLCDQYKAFPEATSGRTATLKSYDAKKYDIKTVDVNY